MRFLCDEMLQLLGRWLRTAGYDTLIESQGRDDPDIIAQARREARILLTRDRQLAPLTTSDRVVVLQSNGLEANVRELCGKLPIDWLLAPFTRCRLCNTPLLPPPAATRARIPSEFQGETVGLRYCARCDKVFWSGGHVARMRRRMLAWQAICAGISSRSPDLY